jgi:hypothetical protein
MARKGTQSAEPVCAVGSGGDRWPCLRLRAMRRRDSRMTTTGQFWSGGYGIRGEICRRTVAPQYPERVSTTWQSWRASRRYSFSVWYWMQTCSPDVHGPTMIISSTQPLNFHPGSGCPGECGHGWTLASIRRLSPVRPPVSGGIWANFSWCGTTPESARQPTGRGEQFRRASR